MVLSAYLKKIVEDTIQKHSQELRTISLEIHDHPEQGNQEFIAFKLLTEYMEKHGFKVTRGVVGLETAFIAEYSNGKNGRRIGFCSEYDALPNIGHGCGHNLIAVQGVACALAVKTLLEKNLISGSVTLFGTPAEESTCSKITLVKENVVQDRVDFAMMLHPSAVDAVFSKTLALDQVVIEFFGKASHAGASPWEGINALDALMQGFDNVAMLRQQTLPTNRIHGIIKHGGNSANVIPDHASAHFFVRALTRTELSNLKSKLENCFKAAAIATGCTVKFTWAPQGQIDDLFNNEIFGLRYIEYMKEKGVDIPLTIPEDAGVMASTDMGNISYAVPSLHPIYSIGSKAFNHTAEFTAAAGTLVAHEKAMTSAVCLAMTAVDASLDSAFFEQAVESFKKGKQQ
ncbi:hypothetical protein G6F70_006036 [Rhizopus microsporus]|uniref:Peptidase M20 domain-containing protein 2 n=1 Tax=Rhizopus microsporus TaxID=58291 RepID=A0A1X0RP62_RHIZD|nr:hypothetical protein G6F71_005912 [Rhizopus microsporus]KAG1198170.1 hypothetical protein G6F70_006036 [Rhizopus microsporus]KAG1209933.1 hypothetical protein G6F69_005937 [Rhizopus microsporus]KAG1231549.1 hypothetical protein G6F67_005682 [Rhizopus microsporus]KAG1263866.1 hypothetical protein G6F68_004795 [Rhizopus microsporus]